MKGDDIFTYDSLYEDHWSEELSCSQIAKKYNVGISTIKKQIKKLNIPMRNRLEALKLSASKRKENKTEKPPEYKNPHMFAEYKDKNVLAYYYWDRKLDARQIGELFGVKKATIMYWMKKLNIPRRDLIASSELSCKKRKVVHIKNLVTVNCAWCNKEIEKWPYMIKRGTSSFYCSKECKSSHWSEMFVGENAFNWKGGHWKENADKRETVEYQKVRDEIRDRDRWTCQLCGKKNKIVAHHIVPVRKDPSKVFDANNLISLCDKCHREKVNGNEEFYEQMFTDIVAKTVNCWDSLKLLYHNTTSNGECEGAKS